MQSITMIFRRSYCLPNSVYRATGVAFIALASLAFTSPASALLTGPQNAIQRQLKQDSPITEVYVRRGGGAVHRSTVVGPRGGVYHGRTAVRGGAVVRPGYRGGGVRWARPGWYRWPAGGAIAAGAALGFVTAASAAAWAGATPGPGLCWYYTDPSQTQGFWDACP